MTSPVAVTAAMAARPAGKSFVRHAPTASRIALGLLFALAGGFGVLASTGLLAPPPPAAPMPEGAAAFTAALMHTGYMLPMIAATELAAGALLLANRYVALALVVLAPVIVNILAYHAFLAPGSIGPGALALLLGLHLAWTHRASYRALLTARPRALA